MNRVLPVLLVAAASDVRAAPPTPPNGEVWSAFFAFNTTSQCSLDTVGARFFTARFSPASPSAPWRHYVSEPYSFPTLAPIHSKTLTFSGGATMAADPIGRRAWALLSTTDWTPHTWVVQISYPASRFNSTKVVGVCEIINSTMGHSLCKVSRTVQLSCVAAALIS